MNTITTLTHVALFLRRKMELLDRSIKLERMVNMYNFPEDCCQASAVTLMYYLTTYMGFEKRDMSLLFRAEITPGTIHTWSMISDIHVDLTADQFGRSPVIVSSCSPWPNVYKSPTIQPFDQISIGSAMEDVRRICMHIRSQLIAPIHENRVPLETTEGTGSIRSRTRASTLGRVPRQQ